MSLKPGREIAIPHLFGIAHGQTNGKFDGFQFDFGNVSINDALLLLVPEAARR